MNILWIWTTNNKPELGGRFYFEYLYKHQHKQIQGSCRILVSKFKELSKAIQGLKQRFSRIFKLIDLCCISCLLKKLK